MLRVKIIHFFLSSFDVDHDIIFQFIANLLGGPILVCHPLLYIFGADIILQPNRNQLIFYLCISIYMTCGKIVIDVEIEFNTN